MNIVLTRPLKDSLKLKAKIEAASGHKCYIQPLLEIEFLDRKIDIQDDAVIAVTSANGIRALAKNTKKRGFRILAVGNYTAAKAVKKGFRNVSSATGRSGTSASEANLVSYIRSEIDTATPIYHISANITKGGLKSKLLRAGYKYKRVILYNADPLDFSEQFIKLLKNSTFDAYSFFSPRTAAIFAKQLVNIKLGHIVDRSVAFCFSKNVVKGLSGLDFKKILIPEVTNKENFIKLICDYKEKT